MNIKEHFHKWLLESKGIKSSKAMESVNVLAFTDENCVKNKADGQYSILDFESKKTADYIKEKFLKPNLTKSVLKKNLKVLEKSLPLLFEFFTLIDQGEIVIAENSGSDSSLEATKENAPVSDEESAPASDEESAPINNGEGSASETSEKTETESAQSGETLENATQKAENGENDTTPTETHTVPKEELLLNKVDRVFQCVSANLDLVPPPTQTDDDEQVTAYFDLINSTVGIKKGKRITREKMSQIYLENEHTYDENDSVFLSDQKKLYVYDAIFGDEKKDVINESLSHSLKDLNLGVKSIYAMLPDVLDEFAKETRSQLVYKGERLFPIPRSIAYALGLQHTMRIGGAPDFEPNTKIIFADYDGDEFVAIQLETKEDREAPYTLFIRKGLQRVKKSNHLSYNDLFDDCIKLYSDTYGIRFDKSTTSYLKSSKAFASLFSTKKPILIKQSSGYLRLEYNENIHQKLINKIQNDIAELSKELSKEIKVPEDHIIAGSCFNENNNFDLLGCYVVSKRIEEEKPLWLEYLPRLSLEVIEDGRYGEIELIGENECRDVLKTIGEEEIIHVNGTLTFAVGKMDYSLPLERSIENDINKEKQCVFKHNSFPLKQSVKVSLEVHYKYGDENSYKLVAVPIIKKSAPFEKVESEWCDREKLPLGKVSKFVSTGGMLPRKASGNIKFSDVETLETAFANFKERLNMFNNPYSNRTALIKPKPDNKGKERVNLFYLMYTSHGARRRVFNLDSYKKDADAKALVNMLARSDHLAELAKIADGNSSYNSDFSSLIGSSDAAKVRDDAREFLADMGVLYELFDLSEIADMFIDLNKIRYLSLISRNLENDKYGVFDAISEKICVDGLDVKRIRNLGANCSYIKNWARNLYETEYGSEALNKIRDKVVDFICGYKLNVNENIRIVRDYMELLVCICTINEIDNKFINPNDPKIKKLVKKIKEIDKFVHDNQSYLKYPFICRLQTDNMDKKELYGMNDLNFMLVQILTGAEDINLTGFEDNES